VFKVGLVQNQSEMAHYGYGDARPILRELGYEASLFTADNIDVLRLSIVRNEYDAIMLGSNALNDKTIRAEMSSSPFREAFREWLAQGRGILCLHQLKLASLEKRELSFLPAPLDTLSAAVRPPYERSADGTLGYGPNAEQHLLLLYPQSIDLVATQSTALNFRSLPGLYWHYWEDAAVSDWETLVVDVNALDEPRPLLLSARSSENFRVVVSALTLDWHRQNAMLENILTYVVEGRHSTAVLRDAKNRNAAFEYLLGTLRSRKFPFRQYSPTQNLEGLERHLSDGVHTTLILGPFVGLEQLPALRSIVEKRVSDGTLKLVSVEGESPGSRRFSVAGRQRSALQLLHAVELHIQSELREGYIDGSFWSTAESLQALEQLPQARTDFGNAVAKSLEFANEHDRNGSYDEVFGVSCALLWMRGTYLGVDSIETAATASWLKERLEFHESREQVLAYTTLDSIGMLGEQEHARLVFLLRNLKPQQLSEMDLVVYLRAALVSGLVDVLPGLLQSLKERQREGAWIDLATTADAITTLLQVRQHLQESPSALFDRVSEDIEEMVFRGIIHIQEAYVSSMTKISDNQLPWDGKASTTVKCIQAWLAFEEFVNFPVRELVDVVEKSSKASSLQFSSVQALSVLEAMKADREALRSRSASLETRVRMLSPRARRSTGYLLGLCGVSYLLLTLVAGAIASRGASALAVLHASFVSGWPIHVAVGSLTATFLGVPWERLKRKVKNARKTAEHQPPSDGRS